MSDQLQNSNTNNTSTPPRNTLFCPKFIPIVFALTVLMLVLISWVLYRGCNVNSILDRNPVKIHRASSIQKEYEQPSVILESTPESIIEEREYDIHDNSSFDASVIHPASRY